jgi:hypothetical protein
MAKTKDDLLEREFEAAVKEYSREALLIIPDSTDYRIACYFFFAGAEAGCKKAFELYEETHV